MKEKQNLKVEERLRYNSRIDRAILRIVHLVDDVLDFVRVSELTLQPSSLISIFDSAIDSIDTPSDVKIKRSSTDATISCDFRKLEAVIANLITNSIQAVNNVGNVEIRLTDNGKTVGIIAYLWLIGWVIALVMHNGNKTEYGAYHIRQALGLMILWLAVTIINTILAFAGIPFVGYIFSLGLLVLWILGFIGAIQGEKKPIPVLGEQFQQWFKGVG